MRLLHCISAVMALAVCGNASAQRMERIPFGDFESWTVREIKESAILGGETKTIYALAPNDTIRKNEVFSYDNTIWSSSNAYAVVMGITKTSCSASPAEGHDGLCAKLESCYVTVKVAGLINIKIFAGGSLYWGKILEPIRGISEPYSFIDWGIPFTRHPKALVLDYRSIVPNTGKIAKGNRTYDGYDPEEIILILQSRKEDEDGNIHVKRVGTAALHIDSTSDGWVKDLRIPLIYGDARKDSSFEDYMDLRDIYYARNSAGKNVPIPEEGWAEPGTVPTHAILSITSGCQNGLAGAVGNILYIDNLRLEYE